MATVRKLKSGNYQALLTVGGKRISATGRTQDDALKAVFTLANTTPSTPLTSPADTIAPMLTLGEAIDKYIDSKSAVISPTTREGYMIIRANRFKSLMSVPINYITPVMLQQAVNYEASRLSPKSVCNSYGLITSAVGMLAPDIHLSATLPRKTKKEIYVPDSAEIASIYTLVQEYDRGRLIKPFLLATQCGLRASEIAGLTVDCVHTDSITIRQAMVYTHTGNVTKQPKSLKGYRTIPISCTLSTILLANCVGDSVCGTDSHYITSLWCRFRARYALPKYLNFHALRHYFASNCLQKNIPQKYVAELMGHNGTGMLEQVYQHTFKSAMLSFTQSLAADTDTLINGGKCDGKCDG